MKQQLAIAALLIVLVVAGCINKTAMENEVVGEKQGVPMIITAEEANLYEHNKVIGKIPVGTKVYMVRKGNPWCIIDVPIEQYEMSVRGAVSADVLAPAKSTPSIMEQVETPAVSPTYDAMREKLWSEFFPETGINAIVCTEDTVWLGTDSGLIKFAADSPKQCAKYDASDGLLDDDVLSIGLYKDEVWVGTYIGLSRFENGDFINYRMSDGLLKGAVMAIDVNDKYVWFGLDTGLSKFNKTTEEFENYRRHGGWSPESGSGSAPTSSKGAIYADAIKIEGDMLWHAAFNLSLMTKEGRDIQTYSCGNGLIHSRVVDFAIDGDAIWCSTLWGLTKLNKNNDKYKQYNLIWGAKGRENPMIASAKDGDSLWIALRDGMCRFDTKKEKFVTYYAAWDMFGGRYISTLASDANYLWVGTAEGLWRMDKSVTEIISDEGLVGDFESRGRILARGW